MKPDKLLAYLLIAVGALFLLNQLSFGGDSVWIAFVAAAFLYAYSRQKRYSFLVIGGVLAGLALGLLLASWSGLFISLAAGLYAVHRTEPRTNRWPVTAAAVLAGIGILGWLVSSDVVGSIGLAILLMVGGLYLLRRGPSERDRTRNSADVGRVTAPAAGAGQVTTVSPAPTVAVVPDAKSSSPSSHAPTGVEPDAPNPSPPDERNSARASESLYERLEAWRRDTAQREERAAYLILTNASLQQIAEEMPQTLEALRQIKGIGPVKLERYGEAILELVRV